MEEEESEPIPDGFTLEPVDSDTFIIHLKRTGMGCMNSFLIVWLSVWTVGCFFLIRAFLEKGPEEMPIWFVSFFCIAEVVVFFIIVYLFLARKSFRMDRTELAIETRILGFSWRTTIQRDSVKKLVQVQDGGGDGDSFPSWGLKIQGAKTKNLIYRQPYQKSRWLGRVLAKWADAEFVAAQETYS